MTAQTVKKIEVSEDLARELVPILEDKITGIDNHIVSLQDEREEAAKTLAELKAKLNGASYGHFELAKGNRLRKGLGEQKVIELLKSLPGNPGLTMQEITKRTGVSYSSVFRMLKTKNKGKFIADGDKWKLKI